jgi:D-galactarolactone cycloisomerase
MKIVDIVAYPITVPAPKALQANLGSGRMVKRDIVVVKVVTDEGLTA